MTKNICDVSEISNYLGISISEVRKLVRGKSIPYFRIGNRIRFDLIEINKWIEELQKMEGKSPLLFL